MKKLLLGLLLALSATAITQGQQPVPRKPTLVRKAMVRDTTSVNQPPVTEYPIPVYNPWPWEYQLPHLFL